MFLLLVQIITKLSKIKGSNLHFSHSVMVIIIYLYQNYLLSCIIVTVDSVAREN